MGIMRAASRLESQHPRGHRARRGTEQGGRSGWLPAGTHLFLSTPLLQRSKEERGKVRKQLQRH